MKLMQLLLRFFMFASLFSIETQLAAQNSLAMTRVGKDKIAIYNPNGHAIAVKIGNNVPFILSAGRGTDTYFALTNSNVNGTPFSVFYNTDCYNRDLSVCALYANSEKRQSEQEVWINSIVALVLQGTTTGIVIDIIRMMLGNESYLLSEILAAYQSNDPYEQKADRIRKIIENHFQKKLVAIENRKDACEQRALQELNTNTQTQTFYASQFIRKQENFRFEVAPYYITGFNSIIYKGQQNKRPAFKELSSSVQIPFGFRANFVYNHYNAYKQRKLDKKLYVTLDYSQSPAIYKIASDDVFKPDTAYSWNFYSLGIGWESLYANRNGKYASSLSLDLGLVTSSNKQYAMDSLKSVMSKISGKSFKEYNIYGCVTFKQKVFPWLDAFVGYKLSANLFGSTAKRPFREIPSYRQFQFGLNFVLARTVNYQY